MKPTLPEIHPQRLEPVEVQFRAKSYVHLKDICTGRSPSEQSSPSRLFLQGGYQAATWWLYIAKTLRNRVLASLTWWKTRSPLSSTSNCLSFCCYFFSSLQVIFTLLTPLLCMPAPSTGVLWDGGWVVCWAWGSRALFSSLTLLPDSNLAP